MDLNKIGECLTSLEDFAFILDDGASPVTQEEIEIVAEELPKIIAVLKKEINVSTPSSSEVSCCAAKYNQPCRLCGFCDD